MTNATMLVHGSCHCGAISYQATVDAARVTVCHCTDCQSLTGTAYRVSVPADAATFQLLEGTPKVYFKVGDSGRRRAQGFCGHCGAPLYTHADEPSPSVYGLRIGAIRERELLVPTRRIWCRSALPWSLDISGIIGEDRE